MSFKTASVKLLATQEGTNRCPCSFFHSWFFFYSFVFFPSACLFALPLPSPFSGASFPLPYFIHSVLFWPYSGFPSFLWNISLTFFFSAQHCSAATFILELQLHSVFVLNPKWWCLISNFTSKNVIRQLTSRGRQTSSLLLTQHFVHLAPIFLSVPDNRNPLWKESWLPLCRRPSDPHKKSVYPWKHTKNVSKCFSFAEHSFVFSIQSSMPWGMTVTKFLLCSQTTSSKVNIHTFHDLFDLFMLFAPKTVDCYLGLWSAITNSQSIRFLIPNWWVWTLC